MIKYIKATGLQIIKTCTVTKLNMKFNKESKRQIFTLCVTEEKYYQKRHASSFQLVYSRARGTAIPRLGISRGHLFDIYVSCLPCFVIARRFACLFDGRSDFPDLPDTTPWKEFVWTSKGYGIKFYLGKEKNILTPKRKGRVKVKGLVIIALFTSTCYWKNK